MKQIEITLPENTSEITLRQVQQYNEVVEDTEIDEVTRNKKIVAIFANLPLPTLDRVTISDYSAILQQIIKGLKTEAPFQMGFTLNGVAYGFEPNLNEISTAAYFDLSTYGSDLTPAGLHKIMAVLFRPVTSGSTADKYTIEPYSGTRHRAELMKDMPWNVAQGAMGFFLTLEKQLGRSILKSLQEVQARERQVITLQSGVGIRAWWRSRVATMAYRRCLNRLQETSLPS